MGRGQSVHEPLWADKELSGGATARPLGVGVKRNLKRAVIPALRLFHRRSPVAAFPGTSLGPPINGHDTGGRRRSVKRICRRHARVFECPSRKASSIPAAFQVISRLGRQESRRSWAGWAVCVDSKHQKKGKTRLCKPLSEAASDRGRPIG